MQLSSLLLPGASKTCNCRHFCSLAPQIHSPATEWSAQATDWSAPATELGAPGLTGHRVGCARPHWPQNCVRRDSLATEWSAQNMIPPQVASQRAHRKATRAQCFPAVHSCTQISAHSKSTRNRPFQILLWYIPLAIHFLDTHCTVRSGWNDETLVYI